MRPELENAIEEAKSFIFTIGARNVKTDAEWEVYYAQILEDCARVMVRWVCEDAEKEEGE